MNHNEYEYKGLPLNKPIIRALLRKLFAGKGFKEFKEMQEVVVQHHRQHRGEDTHLKNVPATFSRVLSELEREKGAERHPDNIQGIWKIHVAPADEPSTAAETRRLEMLWDPQPLQNFVSRELAQLDKEIEALQSRRNEIASLLRKP